MMLSLHASQIKHITSETFEKTRFFNILDEENFLPEHLERLRFLGCKQQEHLASCPLDLDRLDQKLADINHAPTESPPSSPDPEAATRTLYDQVKRLQRCLLKLGGRAPIAVNASVVKLPDPDVIEGCNAQKQRLVEELYRWTQFLDLQALKRRDGKTFDDYKRRLSDYANRYGMKSAPEVTINKQEQDEVDTWVEYFFIEHENLNQIAAQYRCGWRDSDVDDTTGLKSVVLFQQSRLRWITDQVAEISQTLWRKGRKKSASVMSGNCCAKLQGQVTKACRLKTTRAGVRKRAKMTNEITRPLGCRCRASHLRSCIPDFTNEPPPRRSKRISARSRLR